MTEFNIGEAWFPSPMIVIHLNYSNTTSARGVGKADHLWRNKRPWVRLAARPISD